MSAVAASAAGEKSYFSARNFLLAEPYTVVCYMISLGCALIKRAAAGSTPSSRIGRSSLHSPSFLFVLIPYGVFVLLSKILFFHYILRLNEHNGALVSKAIINPSDQGGALLGCSTLLHIYRMRSGTGEFHSGSRLHHPTAIRAQPLRLRYTHSSSENCATISSGETCICA